MFASLLNNGRAGILQHSIEFGRSQDDRSRRCAQAIHRLGGQDKSRRLAIEVCHLLLVLQRGKRHIDGVDLCGRCAYRRAKRRALLRGTPGQVPDLPSRLPPRRNVFQQL